MGRRNLSKAKAGIKCSNCGPKQPHPLRLSLPSNSVSMARLREWVPRLSKRLPAVCLKWDSTATCQMRTSSLGAK
jgi:hypothetical protein